MGLIESGEQWLAHVAVKKAVYAIAKGALALLAYQKAQAIQAQLGVHIDPEKFKDGLAALMLGGLEALHDWLKVRFPEAAKWI